VAARFHVHTEAVDKIKAAELLNEIKNTRWYNSTKEDLTPEDVERIICDNPRLFTLGWRWFEAMGMVGWREVIHAELTKVLRAKIVSVTSHFFRVEFPFNYQYHAQGMSDLKDCSPVTQAGYSYTYYTTQLDKVKKVTMRHWPATTFPDMKQRTREAGELVPLGNNKWTCHLALNKGQIVGGKWLTNLDGRVTEFKKIFEGANHKATITLGNFGQKHIAPATHPNLVAIIEDTDQPMEIKLEAWKMIRELREKQGIIAQSFQWRLKTRLYDDKNLHRYSYTEEDDWPFTPKVSKIGEHWNSYINAGYRLYSHQKICAEVAWKYKRLGLWLDMRLGKTLVGIALAKRALIEGLIDRLVVVCPVTNMYDPWYGELEKQGFNIYACDNGKDEDTLAFDDDEYDAYIISYESLRNRLPLMQATWDMESIMVVMDETSAIKNFQAQRTRAAIDLCEHPEFVFALNGTPMEQGPADIWPQQFAVDRGVTFGSSIERFFDKFMFVGDDRRLYLKKNMVQAFELFLAGSAMRYIRSEGDQFAGKDKNFRYIALPPTEEMFKSTKRIIDGYQVEDSGDIQLVKNCILVTYGHLREAAAGYDKYEVVPESGEYKRRRHQLDPKAVWVRTFLKGNPGQPLICYCEFSESEDRLKEMLDSEGIKYASTRALKGQTFSPEERQRQIKMFNSGQVRVFICKTMQARGITLNRIEAVKKGMGTYPSIVYMQPSWSLGSWKQSQDRAVGTDPVTQKSIATMVYILAVQGSIEMQIVKALRGKNKVQATLLKDAERNGYVNLFDEMDLTEKQELDDFFDAADYEARYQLNLPPPPKKLTEKDIKKAAARYLATVNSIKVKEAEKLQLPLTATLLINKLEGNKDDANATRHALSIANVVASMGADSPGSKEKLDDSDAA